MQQNIVHISIIQLFILLQMKLHFFHGITQDKVSMILEFGDVKSTHTILSTQNFHQEVKKAIIWDHVVLEQSSNGGIHHNKLN